MGLSRRFLSLLVDIRIPGAQSLCFVDLTRHKLFNSIPALPLNINTSESEGPQETTLPAGNPKNGMRRIRLPAPGINLRSSAVGFDWYMDCFPLAGGNLLCTDQSGRATLFNADTRSVESMPYLHKPKSVPVSISVPWADDNDGGVSVFIMERAPRLEQGDARALSSQFEAFTYCRPSTHSTKFWQHQLLPPPPFICNPKYYVDTSTRPRIRSYAVLGGGSQVCISVDRAGTYSLDTVTHTWTQIGDWILPFVGKVEYVPELKLWFGICAKDMQLGAADLSTMDMDFQPQLVDTWKEFEAPQEWAEVQPSQLVNLGSGRFCIARFFCSPSLMSLFDSDGLDEEYFTVLTGVDVVRCVRDGNGTANINDGNGKVELRMIKHNSRRHMSYCGDGAIKLVF
ncbi:hypothetical protein HU200_023401 [Digitaria exilis]|uniref:Uncharacterized protein n=1 Tax=Digitaria exilis TaxID=1010633 RepID=A0A835EWR6_9POAL|nr:hypothetical protein HU200_023401 [Digitaria exilis]